MHITRVRVRECTMTQIPSTKTYSMDTFSPVGLHVLVVDDDPLCLLVMERMLRECSYKVTACIRAKRALEVLRDSEDSVDLVLSDVYMPDVDGFKLLEIVGLELDLPVIMMSANGDTSVVMKGIIHGACDYLIKPVRIEELRNIWQHVVRKKVTDSFNVGSHHDDMESMCSSELQENSFKKRKEVSFGGENLEVEDASSLKRARVNWTVALHQRFVNAVNQLGVEKAVPKKLLDVMNVKGLTRENVASHLQKYRLYLKRLSGVTPEPCPIASFQASEGGKSGGAMRIMPGGTMTGLNLNRPNMGAQAIDLNQFKASEKQKQIIANRAQVLGALGFVDSQLVVPSLPVNRNASFDMRAYVPKRQLVATNSMPCESSLMRAYEPLHVGNEVRRPYKSAQVEGFVRHWNIKPACTHGVGESAAANTQMHGNYVNVDNESARDDCALDVPASSYIGIPQADMSASTSMINYDASLDTLDIAENPEPLNVADYLMDDEEMTFDNEKVYP